MKKRCSFTYLLRVSGRKLKVSGLNFVFQARINSDRATWFLETFQKPSRTPSSPSRSVWKTSEEPPKDFRGTFEETLGFPWVPQGSRDSLGFPKVPWSSLGDPGVPRGPQRSLGVLGDPRGPQEPKIYCKDGFCHHQTADQTNRHCGNRWVASSFQISKPGSSVLWPQHQRHGQPVPQRGAKSCGKGIATSWKGCIP